MMDDKGRDWELLRQFVEHNSQKAFAELTETYLGLVHATAWRELADQAMAEDVTQAVFLILARKASTFRPNIVLAAWLFDTCKFTAKNARRDEQRRQIREQKIAMKMQYGIEANHPAHNEVTNFTINEALSALPTADRQAVLLRFVCGYSLQETGEAFGISENTARMRVSRALDKLRRTLTKAGIGISVIAISELLQSQPAQAASTGLTARITELVFSQSPGTLAGVSAHTIAQGALKSMSIMKLTTATAVTCVLILATGGAFAIRHPWHQTIRTVSAPSVQSIAIPKSNDWRPADPNAAQAFDILRQNEIETHATQSLIADCSFTSSREKPVREVSRQSVSVRLMRPYFCRYEGWLLKKAPISGEWIRDAPFVWKVSDGTTYWDYDARNNIVTKRPVEDLGRSLDLLALPLFDFFYSHNGEGYWTSQVKYHQDDQRELRYVGTETWEGDDYQVVQWSYADQDMTDYLISRNKDAMKNIPGGKVVFTWRFYIRKDKLIHRLIRKMDPGFTYEAAMRNVKLGEKMDAAEFAYTPPTGAKVQTLPPRG